MMQPKADFRKLLIDAHEGGVSQKRNSRARSCPHYRSNREQIPE